MFDKKNGNDSADQYNKVTVDLFEDTPSEETEEAKAAETSESAEQKDTEKKKPLSFMKKIKKEPKKDSEKEDKDKAFMNPEDEEMIRYLDEGGKKKWSKKKLGIVIGVVVALLAAVIVLLVKNLGGDDGSKVYVESVGAITGLGSASGMTNRYTGEVEAQDTWSITLDGGLSVEKCYVAVGDEVKTGQKLFKYNTEELALNKEKKQLEIDSLITEMAQLEKDIVSYEKDLKSASAKEKIELQTQILTAKTTIKKDEYSLKAAKEELENIKKNIDEATVTSKMDGVVKSINEALGNGSDEDSTTTAGVGDANGDNTTYMQILAVGDYRVKGKINETNVWEINEGDGVIIRSRVDEDTTWHGTIAQVKTDSTADKDASASEYEYYDDSSAGESSSSYNFFVELDDSTDLMMGQHVLIELDFGQDQAKSSLMIPGAYVRVDEEKYYVWRADKKNKLELHEIEVGSYNEEIDAYEVVGGLSLDDFIACDEDFLHEGMNCTKNDPALEDLEGDGEGGEFEDDAADAFGGEAVDGGDMGIDNGDGSFEDDFNDSGSSVGFGKNSDSGSEFDDQNDMDSDGDAFFFDEED